MTVGDCTVEYRLIEEFPGYRIGSDGSVWSRRKRLNGKGTKGVNWVLGNEWTSLSLKPQDRTKRITVTLYRDGKAFSRKVHKLVMDAFLGPRPIGMEICHNNGIAADNRLENLRYGTSTENQADRKRHGTLPVGEIHARSKLTWNDVREIRRLRSEGLTWKELGNRFGVCSSTIGWIVSGRHWKEASVS